MPLLSSRTAIILMWLVVFGLFALFRSPMTVATGVVMLPVAGMALTIMLVLWREFLPTVAVMTAPNLPMATLPSRDFVANSWPNSGFRNSGQRGTRGERRDSEN